MTARRTILITGATDGLGRRIAERLAAPDAHLLVHGRDPARGRAVVAAIEAADVSATFVPADFAALDAVRRMAEAIAAAHPQIDVVINNAGIAKPGSTRRKSADGFELHFAVNYLAPFLLTRLLRPRLGAAAPSRIVNVASAGQTALDFGDVMLERGYDGMRAYCQSKLAQVMNTFDLAEEFKAADITVNCLHPATYMDTAMVRDSGISPLNSVETGTDAVMALVALKGATGRYYDVQREARANAQAYDLEARRKLRELSVALAGL
jgi:NAD(P)-dependent dehydrogenase (short-subunit alcohol dehydrogenase family)